MAEFPCRPALQLRPDGSFGPLTFNATVGFQRANGLRADGVAGDRTMARARQLGFAEPPAVEGKQVREAAKPVVLDPGNNFPPQPNFSPLVSNDARARAFGRFEFELHPEPGNREAIRILGNWEQTNIVSVALPQLHRVRGGHGHVRFHRLAARQLQRLWAAWEQAGLLDRALTWDGGFVPRLVRGGKNLSNHAFGTAFDINYEWNGLHKVPAGLRKRGCVRELAPIANSYGFWWGGHYQTRLDGMHFEVAVLQP